LDAAQAAADSLDKVVAVTAATSYDAAPPSLHFAWTGSA
jgi:hypothetical protein